MDIFLPGSRYSKSSVSFSSLSLTLVIYLQDWCTFLAISLWSLQGIIGFPVFLADFDNIHAETLKPDLDTSTKILTDFFQLMWAEDTVLYPRTGQRTNCETSNKKRNLQVCDNWRGSTLLSLPTKVFCQILVDRISSATGSKLSQEQAGFRKEEDV